MDDQHAICIAKTEYREAFNTGDVDRLLSVFAPGFTDFSVGIPSFFGEEAAQVLRARFTRLFRDYRAQLTVSIIAIQILGNTAFDYGWHETTLISRDGRDPVTTRQRYFELWQKWPDQRWKISLYIDNMDLPPAMPDETFVIPQTIASSAGMTLR